MSRRYRVAQWATGNIGMQSLRAVIDHPQLDLVALYVYSDSKAGKDAGELCGRAGTGVKATKDLADVIAARPDCVLYMPDRTEVENVCRILESGANIVTTRMDFHNPETLDPGVRERVEAACRAGRTSLYATGSSPGFISEALPITLLSLQRRLDRYVVEEFADMSSRDSPEMLFELIGFGRDVATFEPGHFAQGAGGTFEGTLRQLATGIDLPLEEVTATGAVAAATRDVEIAAGRVRAGTAAALRMEVTGYHDGRPLLVFRSNWYVTRDVDPAWDMRETGWRVLVEGDTPLDVSITFPVSDEEYAATSPGYTAHRPVNAVPYVVEAEPGIRMTIDLPQVVPSLARLS